MVFGADRERERAQLEEWLEEARRGDPRGFRALHARYGPLVRRQLRGFAELDADEQKDVVQESFIRAFERLDQLRDPEAFQDWLLTISRNRAISLLRRERSELAMRSSLSSEMGDASAGPLPEGFGRERDAALVREAIAALPDGPEKETATLFYVEGTLSAREIAERLGVGKSAVTMRLERFRARIKRRLVQRILAARLQ